MPRGHAVPKGLKDSAWGFNPRSNLDKARPERAVDRSLRKQFQGRCDFRNAPLPPFQGGAFYNAYPGVKTPG